MGSLWSAVRHRTRRTSLVIVTIVGVASLSGCTVPVVGTTGIGVDASGRLVGYLSICEQHIDGVTLDISDPPQPGKDPTPEIGSWTATSPVTSSVAWLLDGKAAGWATSGPLPALVPGRTYSMYGWTKDYSSSAINVNFTVEQLRALKPGQVRYFRRYRREPSARSVRGRHL